MNVFNKHVELTKEEHLNNLRHASELADIAGSQRMLVHYAKQYLELVATMVTSGDDYKRYILSAAALDGGCKIPDKAEQWSVYNNTMPLCELSDEQAAMLFNAWRSGIAMEKSINDQWLKLASLEPCWIPKSVYRIKPKSDRELFIDGATEIASDECETERIKESIDAFIVKLFDSGKFKYIDNTQHFGESI